MSTGVGSWPVVVFVSFTSGHRFWVCNRALKAEKLTIDISNLRFMGYRSVIGRMILAVPPSSSRGQRPASDAYPAAPTPPPHRSRREPPTLSNRLDLMLCKLEGEMSARAPAPSPIPHTPHLPPPTSPPPPLPGVGGGEEGEGSQNIRGFCLRWSSNKTLQGRA